MPSVELAPGNTSSSSGWVADAGTALHRVARTAAGTTTARRILVPIMLGSLGRCPRPTPVCRATDPPRFRWSRTSYARSRVEALLVVQEGRHDGQQQVS